MTTLLVDPADVSAEKILRGLLECAPDAMVVTNDEGVMLLVNCQTEALFGYDRKQLLGKPIELLIPERFRTQHPAMRAKYFANPHVRPMAAGLSLTGLDCEGTEIPVEVSLSPLRMGDRLFAICSIRDATERIRFQTALREQNAALEAASRVKDRFLANLSHELRTPLNAIIGFTGMLLMRLPGALNTQQHDHLQTIESSANHLLALIDNLLDLAKIDSGKVELKLEPVSCRAAIEEVVDAIAHTAQTKGLAVTIRDVGSDLEIRGDRLVVAQILLNLATNAVKFTKIGQITFSAARRLENGTPVTEISVHDTGVGIRQENLERLFEPFGCPEVTVASQNGCRLGLHVSQKLAHLMGGRITASSTIGYGSTFTLSVSDSQ